MKTHRRHAFSPAVIELEERCLPAASILNASLLADGTLRVLGTDSADTVVVQQTNNQLSISGLKIQAAGTQVASVNITDVKKIEVYGYGGNDVINLEAVAIPSMLYGGDGDDTLIGSGANDYLFGGNGNDKLWGRGGNDRLFGEAGNDLIYGENGNDILNGGFGRDTFFGGNANSPASDFDLYHDEFDLSKPIQDGVSASDVVQQRSSNCQTLAALATIASQKGASFIQNNIKYVGGTSYQVFLPGDNRWINVTFDGTWSDTDAKPSGQGSLDKPEFWTVLMNRARVSTYGVNCMAQYSDARWNDLDAQSGYRLKSLANAMYQFSGQHTVVADRSQITFAYMTYSLNNKDLVAAASFYSASSGTNSFGIVANHAYAVTRAFTVSGKQFVELYNPWGVDGNSGATLDKAPGAKQANDGFITIAWSDFVANFSQTIVA